MPTRPGQTDPERSARWDSHKSVVGGRIRAIRLERAMTQERLAEASGVSRNVLIEVELGRRSLLFERLYDIADALDVHIGELFSSDTGR